MDKKIGLIQLVRGIGALLVCFFHMKGLLNTSSYAYGDFFFGSGAIGVPIFFILSGFIIVYTTQNSTGSLASVRVFALKRIVRIAPLYYLVTLIWIFGLGQAAYYFLHNSDLVIKVFAFIPPFTRTTGPSFGFPPIPVGWTLAYEMLFYLFFCVSLFFGKFRYAFLSFIIAAFVVGLPSLFGELVTFDASHSYGFSFKYFEVLASPVMLYFLLGIAIGWVYFSSFVIKSFTANLTLVGVAVVYFWLAYFGVAHFLGGVFHNMLSCGGLLFSLLMLHKARPVNVARPLVYLGDISYSLYLVHPLVIVFLPKVFRSLGFHELAKGPSLFILATALILLLSMFCYEYIERGILGRVSRLIK